MTLDVTSIINETKKDFTRDRASAISEFLKAHDDAVVLSYIKKTRGDSIKFYYLKDGKRCASDYVVKNAKVLINALLNKGASLYQYNDGAIKDYKDEF